MSVAASRSFAVATLAVLALWLAGVARAQGSDWPAPLPAQASAQQATTRQAGLTAAEAAGAQPTHAGAGGVAPAPPTPPASPAPAPPAPGAVADRPADASASPAAPAPA